MKNEAEIAAVALEISEHGAKLVVATPIGVRQAVFVEFPSRKGLGHIMAPGRVVRTDEGPQTDGKPTWIVAVEFATPQWRLPQRAGMPQMRPDEHPQGLRCAVYLAAQRARASE